MTTLKMLDKFEEHREQDTQFKGARRDIIEVKRNLVVSLQMPIPKWTSEQYGLYTEIPSSRVLFLM